MNAVEEKYSVRMKPSIILDAVKLPNALRIKLLTKIDSWNSFDKTNEEVMNAYLVVLFDESRPRPIQDLGTQIGFRLGASGPLEAVGVGASLLKAIEGPLHDINEDLKVESKYRLDRNTFKQLYQLHLLPPSKGTPKPWVSNHEGGYELESKSVVMGKGNHHEYPQALDALNLLQEVPWKIDPQVVLQEKSTHPNTKRFLRVVADYLGDSFNFVWRFDKRGRSYSQGWDINLQNDEFGKALLSLANKEVVVDLDNLKIAVANHAGHDRLTWQERIDWFDDQNDTFDTDQFDEPVLGRKALRAYQDTLDGKPTGYWMSMDATASGLQIMAVLSGCKKSARVCNLVNTGSREDVYEMVADMMNSELAVEDQVSRKDVKKPLMTKLYNSEATPKAHFNDNQLKAFNSALDGLVPGAMDVMKTINACWDKTAVKHSWTLPDGHVAYCKVEEMADVTVSVAGMEFPYRYRKQQPSDNFRSLCPNVIHSIDGYVAREMIRRSDFDMAHIHDCFVFHPNHMVKAGRLYREILADLANMDLLESILTEITGKTVQIRKDSANLGADILASEYALS